MKKKIIALLLFVICSLPLRALNVDVDILSKDYRPIPVLMYDFYTDEKSLKISQIITKIFVEDINSSGAFNLQTSNGISFLSENNGFYQYYITGEVKYLEKTRQYTIQISVLDFHKKVVKEFGYTINHKYKKEYLARVSHDISNEVYESILNIDGYFSSSLLFSSKNELFMSDYDGKNIEVLLKSKGTILSPSFSNKGNLIVYVDFFEGNSVLYIYDLYFNKSIRLGNFNGISLSPVFSHDDKKVMFSLARGGVTNIYEVTIATGSVSKLTSSYAIDMAGDYSYDNNYIVFSSDRIGSNQLYVMDIKTASSKRISKKSGQYHDPVFSPNSNLLSFVNIQNNKFNVGVMSLSGEEKIISTNPQAGNPHWLPGGRHIVYQHVYTKINDKNQNAFYIVDILSGKRSLIIPLQNSRYPSMSKGVLPMKKINAKYYF